VREVNRNVRLQVMLTEDEIRAIDDYQFATRLKNRAEAVRELIRVGLAARRGPPAVVN
jgi:hypothetical protein